MEAENSAESSTSKPPEPRSSPTSVPSAARPLAPTPLAETPQMMPAPSAPRPPPSPIPLAAPENTDHLKDPEYESAMTALITNIHKSNYEWNKRSRELSIAATRCRNNPNTQESPLLADMIALCNKGDKLDTSLADVEVKYAMNTFIDVTEQVQCKKAMAEMVQITNDALKIKLLVRWSSR